jgi:hypothetical protein
MVVWLDIETLVIGKGGTKKGDGADGESGMGDAGFYIPCVCLGVFTLF